MHIKIRVFSYFHKVNSVGLQPGIAYYQATSNFLGRYWLALSSTLFYCKRADRFLARSMFAGVYMSMLDQQAIRLQIIQYVFHFPLNLPF